MSALPPKADIVECGRHVRFVPKADIDWHYSMISSAERLSEPTPREAFKSRDPRGYEQLSRVPAFIFVRARKGE